MSRLAPNERELLVSLFMSKEKALEEVKKFVQELIAEEHSLTRELNILRGIIHEED